MIMSENNNLNPEASAFPVAGLQPCFKVVMLSWRQSRIAASGIKEKENIFIWEE